MMEVIKNDAEEPRPMVASDSPYYVTVGNQPTVEVPRCLPTLAAYLDGLNDKTQTVTVEVETVVTKDDEEVRAKLSIPDMHGTAAAVAENVRNGVVGDEDALKLVLRVVSNLFSVSSITGAIITIVSEDSGVGGLVVTTTRRKIPVEHLVALGAGGINVVEEFKDNCRKQYDIKFPGDDDSGIIVPGRFGK